MNETKYYPQFDGLRALAVLEVVAFHCRMNFAPAGWIGVDLFFALSAFLITSLLIGEFRSHSTIDIRKFYLRRVRRIVPALVFLVAGFSAMGIAIGRPLKQIAVDSGLALSGIANWTRAYGVWGPRDLGHLWSLAIEMQFYLVWPLIALGLLRLSALNRNVLTRAQSHVRLSLSLQRLGILVFALAATVGFYRLFLSSWGARPSRIYNGFDTRIDGFLFGAAFAFWIDGMRGFGARALRIAERHAALLTVLALVVHLVLLFHFDLTKWRSSPFSGTWIALSSVFLVVAATALKGGWVHRVLTSAPLRGLGVVSYGIYLWHYPLLHLLPLKSYSNGERFALIAALSILCATFSYLVVERRFLRKSTLPVPSPSRHVIADAFAFARAGSVRQLRLRVSPKPFA